MNNELPPDPFETGLPQVTRDATNAIAERLRARPSLFEDTIARLMIDQEEMSGSVGVLVNRGARDKQELLLGMRAVALAYLLLEEQQQIDTRTQKAD